MRLYAVALITWAAFVIASSEHDTANLNDEQAADYTDLPAKQIVQPYVTDVEARSSRQTEDHHSDDFANAGLSRSAVHAGEERGSNGASTTDSSSPGSIYATPLTETSIRLESIDKYPFREYPSHGAGYTEDVLFVENAGNFGQKVQDRPRDGTIVIRTREGREDDEYSFQKLHSRTVSPLEDEDTRKRPYISAIQEPLVLALKEESNLAAVSPSDGNAKPIDSETPAANFDEIFTTEVTTENSPPGNIASVLENDVVPEILPTPLARLSRVHNDTAGEKIAEGSSTSAKKSEDVVKTSTTTVEIVPSFHARFSGPIVVAELPDRETQKMVVDYMDDAPETYGPVGNAKITPEAQGFRAQGFRTADSSSITSAAMLNPLQVGITLVNANQAGLLGDNEQSAATGIEDYPRNDLQRLATVDKELVENNVGNQSRIDYQSENFEHEEIGKRVEVDIQKIPDGSVEIQKSIELYHTAPIQEIHYPPEYIRTASLGVIETNNIGSLQRSKQPYDQSEQSESRPTYDIYRGNGQDEKSVIKAPAFSQKLTSNRHEYNALEDDVGRPTVSADYSSSVHEQTNPLELQPFKYNGVQPVPLGPNQFDDTLYDQSNVQHNFNGNDNGIPPRAKPVGTSTRQDAASEPAKSYVPSTYQYSVPQSNQPYDHQHPFRSPEAIRRPEATQLLLRIFPEGSSVNSGFLVPIRRPYPIEKPVPVPHPIEIEKKIPVERLVEKKVQLSVPVPIPSQLYPVQMPVDRVVEKPIRLSHVYPLHVERVIEKKVPYTVQRLIVQSPSYPLRLPAAYPAAYAAAPIDQPAHTTVPLEKTTEKPIASPRPSRPYRTNADRPIDGSGPTETRFTKIYYQKPQEAAIFADENLRGIAGGLTFVPQSETNASQFYGTPYGRPLAYDYNVDKNYIPAAHFSNVKLVILPKKLGGHVILRPQTATPSYAAVPSFGRQVLYNLVEKDKVERMKDEYVGPAPPRKTSQSKAFPQIIKSPQFSTSAAQSLAGPRKSRQPETQHHGSFRQSKMEYGFKPPMVPSIQYDENTASKVEN